MPLVDVPVAKTPAQRSRVRVQTMLLAAGYPPSALGLPLATALLALLAAYRFYRESHTARVLGVESPRRLAVGPRPAAYGSPSAVIASVAFLALTPRRTPS